MTKAKHGVSFKKVSGKRPAARANGSKSDRMRLLETMPTYGVSDRVLRVLALQAGVGTITKDGKQALREIMHFNNQAILDKAAEQASLAKKRTVSADMILHANYVHSGNRMYIGFGDPEKSSRAIHGIMVRILKAGRRKASDSAAKPPVSDKKKAAAPPAKKAAAPKAAKSPAVKAPKSPAGKKAIAAMLEVDIV